MKSGRRCVWAVAILLASHLLGVAQVAAPETASIEGIVFDEATGRPISGVTVWGPPKNELDLPMRAERQATTTAADGRFLLERLSSGRLEIFFFKSGYTDRLFPFTAVVDQRVTNATVRLSPTGVIAGQVLGTQGNPLVKARVHALAKYGSDGRFISVSAQTNDQGEFRILDLPPRRYWIVFDEPPVSSTLIIRDGQNMPRLVSIDFPDARPSAIRPVLYPGVANLAKAEAVEVKGSEVIHLKPVTLSSLGLGSVRVRLVNGPNEPAKDVKLSLGDLNWSVSAMNSGAAMRGMGSMGTISLETHLDAGASLLKTLWPSGIGLLEIKAAWTDTSGAKSEQSLRLPFTGDDSEAELVIGKPEGRLEIRAIREELDGTETPITGSVGGCRPGAFCLGWKLNEEGKAGVTGIPLAIYSVDGPFPMTSTSYVASARQGSRDVLKEGFLVTRDSEPLEVRVKLTAGKLRGKVIDTQGNAVADALVAVLSDQAPENLNVARMTVRTDQLGAFAIDRIPPGTYRAFASVKKDWISDSFLLDDPEFVAQYWDRAKPVQIQDNSQPSVELVFRP